MAKDDRNPAVLNRQAGLPKRDVRQINRFIIVGLTMDGFQLSDIVFSISVVFRVWSPELDIIELSWLNKVFKRIKKRKIYNSSA